MTWNCEQIEWRLSEYADRLLPADERRYFEAHAQGCPKCGALVSRVTAMLAQLHQLEPEAVPVGLERRILEQTRGRKAERKGVRGWLGWLAPVMKQRFAYGAVTLVITVMVLSQAFGVQWSQVELRDLYPPNLYRATTRKANLVYARGAKFVTDLRVVYEIQSRLRPETEQPAPAEQKPAPGQSLRPEEKEQPRQQNRANERYGSYSLLAMTTGLVPGRMTQ